MTLYQTIFFTIFAVIAIMIVLDKNVADYIILLTKIVKMQFERMKFMIIYHPKNPVTNFIQARKMDRLAMELHKELQQRDGQ